MKILQKIGFDEEEISCVSKADEIYGDAVSVLAKAYMKERVCPMEPYPADGREIAYKRVIHVLEKVTAIETAGKNGRLLSLLFWLHCIPYAKDLYAQYGISESNFYDTMMDITYKMRECKKVYGECGVFSPWIFLVFDLKVFALGRLQFEITTASRNVVINNEVVVTKGDIVYSCHIPASGRLSMSECMDSFQKAYSFFGKGLNGNIIPILCDSWMLYPPYAKEVFPEYSNLKKFTELFYVYDSVSTGRDFPDSWRIFGKLYEGNTEMLPDTTTIQKNFISFIKNGGEFGYGFGIRLHDGKNVLS